MPHREKIMGGFVDPVSAPAMWGSVFLLLFILAVGVFDFVALQSGGKLITISQVIQAWSAQYPLIPLLTGIVLGHLFFPTRITGTPTAPPPGPISPANALIAPLSPAAFRGT